MAQIKDVSGTAFVAAEFRAEENRALTPLYRDPVVGLFLSDESRHAAGLVEASFPPVKDMVKIRTRYFDDVLERQLLDLKRTCYQEQGIDVDVTFIPGNYVTDGLIELLTQHDFDCDVPTYFIWEGNTMYLPLDSVEDVLTQLRKHVRQFRLSFDYMAEAVISKTTGDAGVTRLVESFAAMGAPWLSGIREIRSLAREARLSLVEHFTTSQLGQTYGLGRPVTSRRRFSASTPCASLAASVMTLAASSFDVLQAYLVARATFSPRNSRSCGRCSCRERWRRANSCNARATPRAMRRS